MTSFPAEQALRHDPIERRFAIRNIITMLWFFQALRLPGQAQPCGAPRDNHQQITPANKPSSAAARTFKKSLFAQPPLVDQKSVRVLGPQFHVAEARPAKVLEIFRHNDVSAAGNCGCKRVPVIEIRKRRQGSNAGNRRRDNLAEQQASIAARRASILEG